MEKILKKDFCLLLSIKPHSVIGKEISMKDGHFVKILDISIGGSYMLIRGHGPEPTWIGTDNLDEDFIIDGIPKNNEIISIKRFDELSEKISRYSKGGRRYA